jgi:hypothetical protein
MTYQLRCLVILRLKQLAVSERLVICNRRQDFIWLLPDQSKQIPQGFLKLVQQHTDIPPYTGLVTDSVVHQTTDKLAVRDKKNFIFFCLKYKNRWISLMPEMYMSYRSVFVVSYSIFRISANSDTDFCSKCCQISSLSNAHISYIKWAKGLVKMLEACGTK